MLGLDHCVPIIHLHAELPPKLTCITFYSSPVVYNLEQLLDVPFYGDPVGSRHSPAVISSQLILTPHSLGFYVEVFIYLFHGLVWVGLFVCSGFYGFGLSFWFALLEMTGEVGTAKLQKM